MKFLLLTEKEWHLPLFESLKEQDEHSWVLINSPEEFNLKNLMRIQPDKIFIPHWSYIIEEEVYSSFECIVFHMTDLPYGRGGSPLQNLIVRGHKNTKVSALRVENGVDTGAIYLKKELSLMGSAQEIYIRCTKIIFSMILEIIEKHIEPIPQTGKVVEFKRRKPSDGNLLKLKSIHEVYDYIRMLDAHGYPKAFLEIGNFRFEFSRTSYKTSKSIIADVRISEK